MMTGRYVEREHVGCDVQSRRVLLMFPFYVLICLYYVHNDGFYSKGMHVSSSGYMTPNIGIDACV